MRLRAAKLNAIGNVRRGGAGTPAGSLDALWGLAGFTPSFDFPFARNRSLVDAVTGQSLIAYTQASSGTYVNSDRAITTAASNEPRFDHDPATGESLGLLPEEQRTNGIRNNTMVDAVAGMPGTLPINWSAVAPANGITREILGTGTEDGIPYIDLRFSGTNTLGSSSYMDITFDVGPIAVAQGQTLTESVYLRLLEGSISGASFASGLSLILYGTPSFTDNGGLSIAASIISNARLATQRFSLVKTFVNSTTNAASPRLGWNVAAGATIDFTLRIGLPMLEQGAGATSVIPTATAAVTRSASLADLIGSAIANNIRSFYCEFRSPAVGTRGVVSLNDNTANNRAAVITSGTDPRLVVHSGGIEQANVNGGTITAGARTRVAVRINNNDFAISINGSAVVTDTSGTLPIVDRIMIGRTQAGEYLNGRIARFTGWNQLLSDATLRSLSSQ